MKVNNINTQEHDYVQNISLIRKITWIGMIANILLSIVKLLLGVLGNSQALVADAIHSISDLTTDLIIFFGVKLWSKPPDKEHPYGHRRIEILATTSIGIALFGIALQIGYSALDSIRNEQISQPEWIAFAGALISIVIKEILYRWTLNVGKHVKSSALLANAWHHRTDAYSSVPVAIAVAAAAFNIEWSFLDHIGAFIISLFIINTAWGILKTSFSDIIDTGASEKYQKKIEVIIMSTRGIKLYPTSSSRKSRGKRTSTGFAIGSADGFSSTSSTFSSDLNMI